MVRYKPYLELLGKMPILHKVAYNSEEKARFKLRAISEPREKVIPTGLQCKKGEILGLEKKLKQARVKEVYKA